MAKFELAIPRILKWEGGYVWNKADPGGETNYGITDRLDGIVDHKVDLDGDMIGDVDIKTMTVEDAKQVYKRMWDKAILGDFIESQACADILFDGFVNCGKNGIRLLQEILNVKVDGVFGPRSLQVLNLCDERIVYYKYKQSRIDYYNNLADKKPELEAFRKGWLNRINSFAEI